MLLIVGSCAFSFVVLTFGGGRRASVFSFNTVAELVANFIISSELRVLVGIVAVDKHFMWLFMRFLPVKSFVLVVGTILEECILIFNDIGIILLL